jgi:hypothetical protein
MSAETCSRCGAVNTPHTCSWFTAEDICCVCQEEEKLAPNYAAAKAAELAAVQGGNYNFAGIGLAPEDVAALTVARSRR